MEPNSSVSKKIRLANVNIKKLSLLLSDFQFCIWWTWPNSGLLWTPKILQNNGLYNYTCTMHMYFKPVFLIYTKYNKTSYFVHDSKIQQNNGLYNYTCTMHTSFKLDSVNLNVFLHYKLIQLYVHIAHVFQARFS